MTFGREQAADNKEPAQELTQRAAWANSYISQPRFFQHWCSRAVFVSQAFAVLHSSHFPATKGWEWAAWPLNPPFLGDSPQEHIFRTQNYRLEFWVPVCTIPVLEARVTPILIRCRNIRYGNTWSLINHLLWGCLLPWEKVLVITQFFQLACAPLARISLGGNCSNSSERCVCLKQDDDSVDWKKRQLSGGTAQPLVLLDILRGNYEGNCKLWNLVHVGSTFLFHGIKGNCQAQAHSFFT